MAGLTGREVIVGLKQAAAWRTAVAIGAGDGLLVTKFDLEPKIEMLKDESFGLMYAKNIDTGKITADGAIGGWMRYNGLDVLLALIMGQVSIPEQIGVSDAYRTKYTLANNTDGLFATMAILKQSDIVWEYPTVKMGGFKLESEVYKPAEISVDTIADRMELASAVNTDDTMAAVTYPEKGNRLIFNNANCYVRLNDASGAALTSGNNIKPSKFTFEFKRPMEGQPEAGELGISEPISNNFPECTLTLEFSRYDAANAILFTDWLAQTDKKIEIGFIGNAIDPVSNYTFIIRMPRARVTTGKAPVTGPAAISASVTFDLLACEAAPSGMTGLLTPFEIETINTRSTSPLDITVDITTQPVAVSVEEGAEAEFSVVATGTSLTYQVQVQAALGTTWADIEGETDDTYTIATTALSDNGKKYRFKITDGTYTIYSKAVLLTVTEAE